MPNSTSALRPRRLSVSILLLLLVSIAFPALAARASRPPLEVAPRDVVDGSISDQTDESSEVPLAGEEKRRVLTAEGSVSRSAAGGTGEEERWEDDEDNEQEKELEKEEEDRALEGAVEESYLGPPVVGWDEKRRQWLHAADASDGSRRRSKKRTELFIVTGSQAEACSNPEGDHLMLRSFKNKVDYARIQGAEIFYNTAVLDREMPGFWAKLAAMRAAMLAHPEADWFWWLDADAVVTDMEFRLPLRRYAATGVNLVVHGWSEPLFQRHSWISLNAGSFLLRNSQWSLDLLERWAALSPKSPISASYPRLLSSALPDRPSTAPTDDQSALVLLLLRERRRWGSVGKLRLEEDYYLSGYWADFWQGYEEVERRLYEEGGTKDEDARLLDAQYGVGKEALVAEEVGAAREAASLKGRWSAAQRRPFVTHFTGCQPCSGAHNPMYKAEECRRGLARALNYADDQVLRTLGYRHVSLEVAEVRRAPLYHEENM